MGGHDRPAIRLRVLSAGSCRLCRGARCGDCRGPDPAVSRLTRNAVQLRKHFYQATRLVAGLLVVVLAMTGAAKLADQIVTWLAFAVWQPFTIADAVRFWALPPLAPESLGLRRITDAVLSWPGVPAYFLLAGTCLFLFARIDRALARRARKSADAPPARRLEADRRDFPRRANT